MNTTNFSPTAARALADEAGALAESARKELHRVCQDPTRFRMSIPVQKDDSDMLFSRAFELAELQAAQLRAACEALEAERAAHAEETTVREQLEDALEMMEEHRAACSKAIIDLRAQLAQHDTRCEALEGLVERAFKEGWIAGEGCNELEADWRFSNARAALKGGE